MKYSIGERIIIKEDGTVAEVISIISSKIIEVLTEYGNEATVLVKDIEYPKEKDPFPTQKDTNKAKLIEVQELAIPKELPKGFYFSFQPVYSVGQDEIMELKLHFINRTNAPIILEFNATIEDKELYQQKLIVKPSGKSELASIPFEAMNGKPRFNYLICPLEEEINWAEGDWFQFRGNIGLTPKKLFDFITKMETARKDSFEIFIADLKEGKPLPEKDISTTLVKSREKKEFPKSSNNKSQKPQSFTEIDLHTESLHIPVGRLDNFGILSRQLQALEEAIDKAVQHGQPSLIIIHGVGKGKLKEEVHHLLKGHSQVTFFQYSWRPKYGWGATEAFFK